MASMYNADQPHRRRGSNRFNSSPQFFTTTRVGGSFELRSVAGLLQDQESTSVCGEIISATARQHAAADVVRRSENGGRHSGRESRPRCHRDSHERAVERRVEQVTSIRSPPWLRIPRVSEACPDCLQTAILDSQVALRCPADESRGSLECSLELRGHMSCAPTETERSSKQRHHCWDEQRVPD
jgi:hypothetical protein